jgi:hypothetical protein
MTLDEATVKPARAASMRRLCAITLALLLCTYIGIYVWARATGLFSWSRIHGAFATRDRIRTITPLCNRAVIILPSDNMPEETYRKLEAPLVAKKRVSKRLWPFYSWLASVETACRPDMASRE